MDWYWGKNGKRCRVLVQDSTKRKRIDADTSMKEDFDFTSKIKQKMRTKIEREISLYKQQMQDLNFTSCCKKE